MAVFQAAPGTRDILDPESARWRALIDVFAHVAGSAGFGEIRTPIFEDLGVFMRLGESSDVVTKQMYDFEDKGGRRVTLRPEFTAGMIRAFVQHNPTLPWKAWAEGSVFRYEKPQKGRYRQFNQVDVEVLGTTDPMIDVEVIALGWRFYQALGLRQVRLVINSLGDAECRPVYLAALTSYFESRKAELSEEGRITLALNPLRVLDSKRPEDVAVVVDAPTMLDSLSLESKAHFDAVQAGLAVLGIPFEIETRLVRGLDYYRYTLFEFVADSLDSAQNAIGGGGRYDGLVADLGGDDVAGIGFGLGVDRTLLACDAEGVFAAPSRAADAFVVDTTGGLEALKLCAELQAAGVRAERAYDNRSMKSQMKAADRSGARVAVLVGSNELADGVVTLRPMRGHAVPIRADAETVRAQGAASGENVAESLAPVAVQRAVPRDQIVSEVENFLQ